jgi:hypothetical protein
VITNIHDAYLSGRLRPGIGIGSDMVSAMIDADGIRIQHHP